MTRSELTTRIQKARDLAISMRELKAQPIVAELNQLLIDVNNDGVLDVQRPRLSMANSKR
jgi:hypothetical protein